MSARPLSGALGRGWSYWREWGNKASGYWLVVDTVTTGRTVELTIIGDSAATERHFIGLGHRSMRYRASRAADRSQVVPRVLDFGMKANHSSDDENLARQFRATRQGEPIDLGALRLYGTVARSEEEQAALRARIVELLNGDE